MSKIVSGVYMAPVSSSVEIEDHNKYMFERFSRLVKRRRVLNENRHLFRIELVNLNKIAVGSQYEKMLFKILGLYRSCIKLDRVGSMRELIYFFEGTVLSDSNWMSMYMRSNRENMASFYDEVQARFDEIDIILEGCYKHQFKIFQSFAEKKYKGTFMVGSLGIDFGKIVSQLSGPKKFSVLIEDPRFGVAVNQWRNISAHRSYKIKSSKTLEVTYGSASNKKSLVITKRGLLDTLNWCIEILGVLRMANVIIYIEYMKDLKAAGLKGVSVRFDSSLLILCYNMRLVGFDIVEVVSREDLKDLIFYDVKQREGKEAIIHLSQVLVDLCMGIYDDVEAASKYKIASVTLIDPEGNMKSVASVNITDAVQYSTGKISLKKYIDRVRFSFCS